MNMNIQIPRASDFSVPYFPGLVGRLARMRKLSKLDVPELLDMYSDRRLVRYQIIPNLSNASAALRWLEREDRAFRSGKRIRWAIQDLKTNELNGTIWIDWLNDDQAEVNCLGQNHPNVEDAIHCICDFAFRNYGFSHLTVACHTSDHNQLNRWQKSGFKESSDSPNCGMKRLKLYRN
jgi:RimJ/RimL family protein N-acetyltransferase